jgi:hypothetical protein
VRLAAAPAQRLVTQHEQLVHFAPGAGTKNHSP